MKVLNTSSMAKKSAKKDSKRKTPLYVDTYEAWLQKEVAKKLKKK